MNGVMKLTFGSMTLEVNIFNMCSKYAGHWIDKCVSRGDRLSTISVSDTLKLSLVQAVALLENLVLNDALKLNAYMGFVDNVCYTG